MGYGVKRYGRKVADAAVSDIFSKSKLMARFLIAPWCPFPQKRGHHRGPRGPR